METVIEVFQSWFATDAVVYECRHCGRTVDPDVECCPECGATEIVEYDVE